MSDKMEELESPWLLSSLSLEYDERFLPTIWPQLFRRTDIAEIAKVGSLVAWKQNKHTELVDRWSPYCHFLIEKIKYIDITQSTIDNILPNTNTVNIARIYLIGLFSKSSYENLLQTVLKSIITKAGADQTKRSPLFPGPCLLTTLEFSSSLSEWLRLCMINNDMLPTCSRVKLSGTSLKLFSLFLFVFPSLYSFPLFILAFIHFFKGKEHCYRFQWEL